MIARSLRHTLIAIGVLLAVSGEAGSATPGSIHGTYPGDLPDARRVQQTQPASVLAEPFFVQIDALPAATTAVTLKRVRYEPDVELAEQPIDGPRLLLIESGSLALEFARSGAVRFSPGSSGEGAVSLPAGDEHQVTAGDIVFVPAGVPFQLANRTPQPVAWLQIQAETPPTICACGEDLTGSETTRLASQTLEQPIAVPATVSIAVDELAPQQAAPAPTGGAVQLIVPLDPEATLSTGSDGLRRNDSTDPWPIYVVTLGASRLTT